MRKPLLTLRRIGTALLAIALFNPCLSRAERFEKNGFSYSIAPPSSWVVPSPAPINASFHDEPDIRTPLNDIQVSLFGEQPEYYVHYQMVALQSSGLEKISQISISFSPEYETLTLHDISVIRNGQRIARLPQANVDMLRREQGLEAKLAVDGQVTALIVLSDIRVGDIIDVAYSTYGTNPVYGNRFTMSLPLNHPEGIGALRLRVVYPESHKLQYRMINSVLTPAITQEGRGRTLEISNNNIVPVKMEEDVPLGFSMFSWLHISEYRSWSEVNDWAMNHFSAATNPDPAVRQLARNIAAKYPTLKARAAAALAFVQNEIRYFGVELGTSSHVPKPAATTLTDRYGDCKDKTILLIGLLRELGVEAYPALVSAQSGPGIAKRLPSPFSFDHVITHAIIDGNVYWLDATLRHQGSNLDTLGFYAYGKALVVRPGARELTDMSFPADYMNRNLHHEIFTVTDFKKPVALSVSRTYHRQYAEYVRASLSARGLEAIQKDIHDQLLRNYPKIVTAGAAQVKDDLERNTIEVIVQFELPDFLKYETGRLRLEFNPSSLVDATTPPRVLARQFPLALRFPEQLTHFVEVRWPETLGIKLPPLIENSDAFLQFHSHYEIHDNVLLLEQRIAALASEVAPQQVPQYLERLKKIRSELGGSLQLAVYNKEDVSNRYETEVKKYFYFMEDSLERARRKQIAVQLISDDVIRAGKLDNSSLLQAYMDRAAASTLLDQCNSAVKDLRAALKLDSSQMSAKRLQADALAACGNHRESLQIIDEVRQKNSTQQMLSLRARNLFMLGKYREAEGQLQESIRLAGSTEAAQYDLLWLALAQLRQGKTVDEKLRELALLNGLSAENWPGPIWLALSENTSGEKVLREANKQPMEARLRRTEALFYLGQQALAQNQADKARNYFLQSIDIGASPQWEYIFSKLQLGQ